MKNDLQALWENVKTFRLKSFFVRNLLIIMLVVLVPVTAVGVAFCTTVRQSADKEIDLIAASKLANVQKTVDMMIHTAEMFAIQTSLEQNVNSFLYATYQTTNISKVQSDIRKYITSFINVHQYIHSVYIYSAKTDLIMHNNEIYDMASFKDMSWKPFYQALPIVGRTIVPRRYADRYPAFISVICSVGVEEAEKSGCVVVNIDIEKVNEAIHDEEEQQTCYFLADEKNTIYLSRHVSLVGCQYSDVSELLTDASAQTKQGATCDYIYSETPSQWKNLKYISLTPKLYFNDVLQYSFTYMMIMLFLLVLSVMLITVLISIRTYAPIQSLLTFLTPQELNDSRNKSSNEINYITENIKRSIDKNQKLEEELNHRLLLLNQAQIYALQTQINPHFLNNMLDTISWIAVGEMGMTNKVSKMLRSLSGLLNISLDSEHYLIPIEEELQHANIYTYIMSETYGDDLNFVWDIDEALHECRMLKLTLQPILENAIEHGIKPKRAVGEIKIIGRVEGKNIRLSIRDNGVGMSERNLEQLRQELQNTQELSGKHIGIKNVNQRIKLVFGEGYGLSIDSRPGQGTTVDILIPRLYFE